MRVYKVVRKDKGKLKSAIMRREPLARPRSVANLTYQLGKATKPRFGKLFAFDTRKAALSFAGERCGLVLEVYKAEAPDSTPASIIASDRLGCLRRFKEFWADKEVEEMVAPDGTVVCSELTLTGRIA